MDGFEQQGVAVVLDGEHWSRQVNGSSTLNGKYGAVLLVKLVFQHAIDTHILVDPIMQLMLP